MLTNVLNSLDNVELTIIFHVVNHFWVTPTTFVLHHEELMRTDAAWSGHTKDAQPNA